jgi:hypothetical protein
LAEKRADLSKLIVVGDSLSAGFQSNSLVKTLQVRGYANLIANSAGVDLTLPLITEPGVPKQLQLLSLNPLIITEKSGAPGVREAVLPAAPFFAQATNLAVPGAKVQDALTARPNLPIDSLTDLVLGFPEPFVRPGAARSQSEWAQFLRPTTILLWIGNNDVLMSALGGTTAGITPIGDFALSYVRLAGQLASTGADLVLANVPDVTLVAAFVPAEKVAEKLGQPLSQIGPSLGISRGSFITQQAFQQVFQQWLATRTLPRLPGTAVLDPDEVAIIRLTVKLYNIAIEAIAHVTGATLVDINELVSEISKNGYQDGAKLLNTEFLGGLFSLDGVHPTNKGYAVIANEFIKTMNKKLMTRIPLVSVASITNEERIP